MTPADVSHGKRHHAAAGRMASGVCSADAGDDCLFGGGISCDCCVDHMVADQTIRVAIEKYAKDEFEPVDRMFSSICAKQIKLVVRQDFV